MSGNTFPEHQPDSASYTCPICRLCPLDAVLSQWAGCLQYTSPAWQQNSSFENNYNGNDSVFISHNLHLSVCGGILSVQ